MRKLVVAALFISPALAFAADPAGPYLGLGLGQTHFSSPNDQIDIGPAFPFTKNSTDTAYKVFGGYRLHKNFAVEAEYLDLGTQSVKFGGGIDRTNDMSAKGYNFSVVGLIEVAPSVELFGKLGASYIKNRSYEHGASFQVMENMPYADNSDTKWRASYGVGAQYNFAENWSGRVEWQKFDAPHGAHTVDLKMNLISASIAYKF